MALPRGKLGAKFRAGTTSVSGPATASRGSLLTLFVREDPRRAHLVLLLAVVVLDGVVPQGVGLRGAARHRVDPAAEAHGEVAVVVRAVVARALGDLRATSTRAPGATPSMIRTVRRTLEIFPACRLPVALLLRTQVTLSSSRKRPGIATGRIQLDAPCGPAMGLRHEAAGKAAGVLAPAQRNEKTPRIPGEAARRCHTPALLCLLLVS